MRNCLVAVAMVIMGRLFVIIMTVPMAMPDAVGMDVIMLLMLTMPMAVVVLALAMTVARAIGMHVIVGMAAHGGVKRSFGRLLIGVGPDADRLPSDEGGNLGL